MTARRMGRALLLAAALAVGFATVRGAAPATAAAAPTGTPLKVLAYDTRPFFYRDGGKPAGLEYEILEYYARAKGRPLQVVWVDDFDQVIGRLAHCEDDGAAVTSTAAQDRQQLVDFPARSFPLRLMLVEPRDHTTTSLADLAGATLAT